MLINHLQISNSVLKLMNTCNKLTKLFNLLKKEELTQVYHYKSQKSDMH